jgi:hypothetical protein
LRFNKLGLVQEGGTNPRVYPGVRVYATPRLLTGECCRSLARGVLSTHRAIGPQPMECHIGILEDG